MIDFLFGVLLGGCLGFALLAGLDTMARKVGEQTCLSLTGAEECVLEWRPVEEQTND